MKQHTLLFTDQDLVILNEALVNLPFKVVAPLIDRIGQQLQNSDLTEEN
jgi:hypothetical protein